MAKDSSLTVGERRQLKEHEETIERGINSFVDVGKSLIAIRDGGLYTDTDKTFEGYCSKRWGFSRPRAYQLIDAAKVVETVSTIGRQIPPPNERIARELAELPDEQTQATVWAKAIDTAPKDKAGNPKMTAAHVKKTVESVAPQAAKPEKVTRTETPEPEKPEVAELEIEPEGGYETHEARPLLDKADKLIGQMTRMVDDLKKFFGGQDAIDQLEAWDVRNQKNADCIRALRKLARKR